MPEKITIAERNLAGNPISFNIAAGDGEYIKYRIKTTANVVVYEGVLYAADSYAPKADISTLFNPEIQAIGRYIIEQLDADDEVIASKEFTVYPGGLNKVFRRKMKLTGKNIFDLKFKNVKSNFFLTTRTFNAEIFLPENELLPLGYYAEGMNFSIKAGERTLLEIEDPGTEEIRFIDFGELRRQCALTYKEWVSVFRIFNAGGWSCTVIVTEAEETEFYLKFRNSLGILEKIALYEEASYVPAISESNQFLKYDSDLDELTKQSFRKKITNSYSLYSRCENQEDRMFLLDSLLAGESYLSVKGVDYAAEFTADIAELSATNASPITVNIKAVLNDDDSYFTPAMEEKLRLLSVNGKYLIINNKNVVI